MFYGHDQAAIHDGEFGDLAREAASYLLSLLEAAGVRAGMVVDLGCGSGILAGIVSDAGYGVLGTDISADMVELAKQKAPKASFRVGSLLDLDLPPAVAVTAIGEVLNYATDPRAGLEALERLAMRVHDALVPGGVFLFDVAGPGRHGPDGIRFHDRGGWVLVNRVEESADRSSLDRRMTIFRATDSDDEMYRRSDEHHILRLYEPAALTEILARAGFTTEFLTSTATASTPSAGWTVALARPAA